MGEKSVEFLQRGLILHIPEQELSRTLPSDISSSMPHTIHPITQAIFDSCLLQYTTKFQCLGEGDGTPLQYSCLENPRDGGAWWAAVYGVTQSRTPLKRLSSSSSSMLCLCDSHYLQ